MPQSGNPTRLIGKCVQTVAGIWRRIARFAGDWADGLQREDKFIRRPRQDNRDGQCRSIFAMHNRLLRRSEEKYDGMS